MNRSKFFLIVPFVLGGLALLAQTNQTIQPQNINIASPTAASLGKVADIPISYHTGIPNISIPIYTIHEGPLSMPISLDYHAGGLRVDERAGWVGAGWNLSGANGVITRAVRGAPDEKINTTASQTNISYLMSKGYSSYLFNVGTGSTYIPNVLPLDGNGNEPTLDYLSFSNTSKDGEPDLFTFNFNSYSGKFYFRADNTIALAPQQDIKISPQFCGQNNPNCSQTYEFLYGFIITTPDGVKYYFGKNLAMTGSYNTTTNVIPTEYTTSYSYTSGINSGNMTASSWYLYKIQSPDGQFSINLTYTAENYSYYTMSMFPQPSIGQGMDLVKNFTYGVRLNNITFSNGSVVFNPSPAARHDLSSSTLNLIDLDPTDSTNINNAMSLAEVRIYDQSTPYKSFVFAYSYFTDKTGTLNGYLNNPGNSFNIHCDKKRLKLLSLTEKSYDGSITKPPHLFTYYNDTSVPRTLSFAQDHWGFYNGATGNQSMIPTVSLNGGITNSGLFNANRESSPAAMKSGTLNIIQYPTGGTTRLVLNNHVVTLPLQKYDSIHIGDVNAAFTATSTPIINFTITATTTFKARISYSYPQIYSSGTVNIYGPNGGWTGATAGLNIFTLPAGTYSYSVTCSSNSYPAVMCSLWEIVPTYQTFTDIPVGGLRIDSLIYNDGISSIQKIETFSYLDANQTNQGVLYSRPSYVALIRNDRLKTSGGMPDDSVKSFYYGQGCLGNSEAVGDPFLLDRPPFDYMTSASAIYPLKQSQGNHFGYNQVKVTQSDGGYTIYKFHIGTNTFTDVSQKVIDISVCDQTVPNYPPAPDPFVFERGELVDKLVYNTAGLLLTETKTTPVYTYETVGVTGLIAKSYTTGIILATEYELKSARKTQSTEETYTYDANNAGNTPVYHRTDTYYGSLYHTMPTKITTSESTGGKILDETHKTYVADMTISSCQDPAIAKMTFDSNMTSNIIDLSYVYNYQGCVNSNCKFTKWLQYIYYLNKYKITDATNRYTADSTYFKCSNSAGVWSAANPDLKALIKLRNRNQVSPVIESSKWRDGNFLESAFLTYKDFVGDSLSIYPSEYDVIKTGLPQPVGYLTPVSASSSVVTKDIKYTLEETYRFASGNMVEITPRNGVVNSYLWDVTRNFPIAKAVGVSYATLSAAYAAAGSNLSTLRSQPTLSGQQVSTYTYDPLIGITTMVDPNNVTTTFVYDKIGRLSHFKDFNNYILQHYIYNYKQ